MNEADSNEPDPVDIRWHPQRVDRAAREEAQGHRGGVVWFTGLSGCGKSTLAVEVDHRLFLQGRRSFVLDGDNVRHELNASPARLAPYGDAFARRFGLGFSPQDRQENIRRIAAVAGLFADAGVIALVAFVSPYREDRDAARRTIEARAPGSFLEVFVDAPLEVCESRDPKGLYRKARAGELPGFTGIDAPYEPPTHPELRLDAANSPPHLLADKVLAELQCRGWLGG